MASAAINISEATGGGVNEQFSGAVTVGASEIVRVRFSKFEGASDAALEIVANSVTSFVKIDSTEAWATIAVAAGDVCRVRVNTKGDDRSNVVGVLETLA